MHIAIIPDGNRRWAKEKGLPAFAGHKAGFDRVLEIVTHAQKCGLEAITIYAFSTENWRRAEDEVEYLMDLISLAFNKYLQKFHRQGIRVRHLGDASKLSQKLQDEIKAGETLTKNNPGLTVQLAINYGGRDEIKRTIQKLFDQGMTKYDITEDAIGQNIDTAGVPDPDLIIRTSGERRLSGFLLWQASYAELYFTDLYWPDFTTDEFDKAVNEFESRQRRFGN